jgi:hypothetical protein
LDIKAEARTQYPLYLSTTLKNGVLSKTILDFDFLPLEQWFIIHFIKLTLKCFRKKKLSLICRETKEENKKVS